MRSFRAGSPAKQKILRTVLLQPGISRAEVADTLQTTRPYVSIAVRQLVREERLRVAGSFWQDDRSAGDSRSPLVVTDRFWTQHAHTRNAILPVLKPDGQIAYARALENALVLAARRDPSMVEIPPRPEADTDQLQAEYLGYLAVLHECFGDTSRNGEWFRGPGAWDLLITAQAQIIIHQKDG